MLCLGSEVFFKRYFTQEVWVALPSPSLQQAPGDWVSGSRGVTPRSRKWGGECGGGGAGAGASGLQSPCVWRSSQRSTKHTAELSRNTSVVVESEPMGQKPGLFYLCVPLRRLSLAGPPHVLNKLASPLCCRGNEEGDALLFRWQLA